MLTLNYFCRRLEVPPDPSDSLHVFHNKLGAKSLYSVHSFLHCLPLSTCWSFDILHQVHFTKEEKIVKVNICNNFHFIFLNTALVVKMEPTKRLKCYNLDHHFYHWRIFTKKLRVSLSVEMAINPEPDSC